MMLLESSFTFVLLYRLDCAVRLSYTSPNIRRDSKMARFVMTDVMQNHDSRDRHKYLTLIPFASSGENNINNAYYTGAI